MKSRTLSMLIPAALVASTLVQDLPAAEVPAHSKERPIVALYEFRSSVSELAARGSTDMFIAALVANGKYRVVERSQMNQGIIPEKQLNGQGLTTGANAQKQLLGADFIFEGTVTEVNASETQHDGSIGLAGVTVNHGKNTDVIAVDVRIVDAGTGEVLGTVRASRSIKSTSSGISGLANLLGSVSPKLGLGTPYAPDAAIQTQRKASLDTALRTAIDDAVKQLAARF